MTFQEAGMDIYDPNQQQDETIQEENDEALAVESSVENNGQDEGTKEIKELKIHD